MRRSDLGEFEEIVLLAVAALSTNAYTLTIAEDLERETGNVVTTGAVHAAMQRLEQKGYLRSAWGEATAERGGRRKRMYSVTALGGRILEESRAVRNRFWERILPAVRMEWN
ncbi:PadR family transcriptional regulator [Dyadobacter chenwenxiniae]|uniref:PadR family transcriptional regulator n=1 Tax=Dyadobacter chenwenxiniae TaxID=2906456 RepID=A0A9X1PTH0_9BACT|nr:helix-turn-helix transcriptional regulator [Dyadobacter chenwenxiniae]MCF0065804.1 PadR family transcriptional regulator [Dyadobacter chenwenxiniae]UON84040.1 PadR family transcriptional regulator [Dyadobacter chenwenxiniae]